LTSRDGDDQQVDGEPTVVVPGGVGGQLRFAGMIGGEPLDPTSSGHVRLRKALRTLSRNNWITVESDAAETRIRLGDRAKRLRAE
jgi:hypothetical protein